MTTQRCEQRKRMDDAYAITGFPQFVYDGIVVTLFSVRAMIAKR